MFGFRKNREAEKQFNYAIENLYSFWGKDLPIINSDGYDYIGRCWKNIGVVYNVTSMIYEKLLQCPVLFYRVKDKKALRKLKAFKGTDFNSDKYKVLKLQALEEINPNESLEKLIKNPNGQQRYSDFLGVAVLSYLITGNSYVYKQISDATKRPYEIWAFPELHINSGGKFNPVKNYSQFYQTANQENYPAETIFHCRTANPSFDIMGSQLYGVSPLRAHLEPLRTIDESNKQSSKQMKNGGVLALMSPQRAEDQFSSEQRDGFMTKFKNALRSQDSGARYLTSSIPMDVQNVGLPSSDLDLLATKSANEESIYKAYRVPLQFYNQDSSSYNNLTTANIQYITNAVAPVAKIISEMFTEHIGVHFDDTIIELDTNSLPEMSGNMKEQVEWISKATEKALITIDEGRYQLGYGELNLDYTTNLLYNGKPLSKIFTGEMDTRNSNNNNGAT